jgi:hypothetical protein
LYGIPLLNFTIVLRSAMKKYFISLIFLFSSFLHLRAQTSDTALITAVLNNIAAAQVSTNGEFYAGSFPSYRKCWGIPHNYQPDNNIFFTAITVFTLRNLLPRLSAENKKTALQIIENAQKVFPFYRDAAGYPFYSFWPTGKGILPHSLFIKKIKLINMGQDADDAVMSLMATAAKDSTCALLKQRMTEVSNGSKKKISSTYPRYRNIPAYSTWLGFKMKPDFDLGVHCNILYFMLDRRLPLVKQDSATIQLLAQILQNREYMKAPVYISPYYVKPAVLMYHLARLMGRFSVRELEPYRAQLVSDIQQELSKTHAVMDKIILSTSLIRLGVNPPELTLPGIAQFEKSRTDKFVFFQARAAFSYPTPFKQIFLHWSYMCYYFYCPAYNKVLWLEYLVDKGS